MRNFMTESLLSPHYTALRVVNSPVDSDIQVNWEVD
jgi:hypothetical protein